MSRPSLAALAMGALALATAVPAQAQSLVSLQADTLNGDHLAIPANLPAAHTVLLMGFRHEDQDALEAWRTGLGLSATPGAPWLEIPVIPVTSPLIRPMIQGGMKKRFADPALRAHVAPMFTDPKPVAAALGLDGQGPAAVVIDREGHVLARAAGPYDAAKGETIQAALKP